MSDDRARFIRCVWRYVGPRWDRSERTLVVPLIPKRMKVEEGPLYHFATLTFAREACTINGYPGERVMCEGVEVDRQVTGWEKEISDANGQRLD